MNISTVFLKRSFLQTPKCTSVCLSRKLFATDSQEHIEIPKRISRGPTDILRALESTVSRDPTAAHYKYHDDPYLIPKSNLQKRTFAMAQEAGKKAAHWVRQENASLFNHREMDPVIEVFLPKMVYTENSVVTEEDLKSSIKTIQISDSILVYKLLQGKGIEVSEETRQALLELVCYFNNEDTLSEEFVEERWFRQGTKGREKQRKTWKDGSFAEEIFISMDNPSAEAYAALIQGMANHYQINRSWQLYEEAQQKNLILPTETYNSMLKVVNFLKESFDLRWSLIVSLLNDMNKTRVKPDIGTMNAILQTLSAMGGANIVKDTTLQVLREFKDLGIEPSLGSWYNVLVTFCKERGPVSTILLDIMHEIEHKEHEIRDFKDTNFFVTAMDICHNHLNDVDLAKRVDKLLHFGNNYNLIGDSYKESIYYRHYFMLLINNTLLEEFMSQTYDILVPNIYVPEPSVMAEVLNQVDISGAVQFVPKLWSDIIIFDMANRENLLNSILNTMVNNKPEDTSELTEKFSYIAWNIYSKLDNQQEERTNKISFTGELLGKIMLLNLRNDEFDKASTIMEKLDKEHQSIVGVPKVEALSLFIDKCIEHKTPSRAINCIQYASDSGFPEANEFAAKLNEKLTLDETHLNSLAKIVGNIELGAKISNSST